jgi:hypothetical protein
MGTQPDSGGNAGARPAPADSDAFHGALVVVAAAAGLVWALSHGTSEGAGDEPTPDRPRPAR